MKVLIYIVISVSLISCSDKGGFLPDDNQYSFQTFPISTITKEHKKYQFTSNSLSGNDLKLLVLAKLQKNIEVILPKLPEVKVKSSTFTNLTDSLDKMTGDPAIKRKSSAKVVISDNNISISFIGGEYNKSRKAESIQTVKFPILLKATKNSLLIEINPATSYISKSGNMGSRGEIVALYEPKIAKNIFSKIYENINIKDVSYRDKRKYSKSSLLSTYPVDAVFATIKTKEGYLKYSLNDEVGRGASYEFFLSKVKFVSVMKIYPYKNKTKVFYEAMAYQNVTLFSNGKSTLKPYPNNKEFTNYINKLISN